MEPTTLLLIVLTTCICLYYYVLNKFSHFERLKVPHIRPIPFLGNMTSYALRRLSIVETIDDVYNKFPNLKYFGFYDFVTPVYVIRDPELINTIAVKNFDNFIDHRNFINEDLDPIISRNLFGLRGDHWREMRKLISPVFTSSKMKFMFELMRECGDNFANCVASESGASGKTFDMKEIICRYTNDVIATCAFGIHIDSFKNPNNEFYRLGREAMNFDGKLSFVMLMSRNFPKIAKFLKLRMFSSEVGNFFKELVMGSVKARDEQGIVRPDLIHLMMETRGKDHGPAFDIDEMTAQALVFFLAGFDSVSSMMCFLTHEVAVNPDVQSKLRAEIDDVVRLTNGKPTYEAIQDMKYLAAVVNETLRMYPLTAFIDRLCVKEFELPPATPDGDPVKLKPGENVWFPSYSLHRDPKYFPEPNKFDPDRFLNDQVNNSVYIPFGLGPRICIANRFALMKTKIMLFHLLWRCELESSAKTKIPLVLSKQSFIMMAEGGFWLKMCARQSAAPIAQ